MYTLFSRICAVLEMRLATKPFRLCIVVISQENKIEVAAKLADIAKKYPIWTACGGGTPSLVLHHYPIYH